MLGMTITLAPATIRTTITLAPTGLSLTLSMPR